MNRKIDDIICAGVSRGKLKAYLHEYPFLGDYLPEVVMDLKTSRINKMLISRNRERDSRMAYERIIFLGRAGNYIGEVGVNHFPAEKRTWKNWFPKPSFNVEIEHEAVFQAVLRLEEESFYFGRTSYIVTVCDGKVTVYKPPKLDENELLFGQTEQEKVLSMVETVQGQQKENELKQEPDYEEFVKEIIEIQSV